MHNIVSALGVRRSVRFAVAVFLVTVAGAAHAVVTPFINRTLYQSTVGTQTVIDFERGFGPATGSGFIPTFTEAGYVTFNADSTFRQEVIDGFNVGQGDNDVYTTFAPNKGLPILDVTFGRGVSSFGFDFKDTANGASSAGLVPMSFTFTLFSGTTNLGSFIGTTVPDGSTLGFLGFSSDALITGVTAVATVPGASPNLDLVLDNFRVGAQAAAATAVPEPGTVPLVGAGMVVAALAARRRARGAI